MPPFPHKGMSFYGQPFASSSPHQLFSGKTLVVTFLTKTVLVVSYENPPFTHGGCLTNNHIFYLWARGKVGGGKVQTESWVHFSGYNGDQHVENADYMLKGQKEGR